MDQSLRHPAFVALASLMLLCAHAGQASGQTVSDLDFMSGCWEGPFGSGEGAGVIEERYTTPSVNVLLGTTRYLRAGETTQFEFTLIESMEDGRVAMTPYPRGSRSEHSFVLTGLEAGRATFEAPEHDFPKRIVYDGSRVDVLSATIDGGPGSTGGFTWTMQAVSCDAGRP